MLHENPWWTIMVPDHWQVEQDEDCTSFTDPDGVGALQVSAARKESGFVTADDVEEFAQGKLSGTGAVKVTARGWFSGLSASFVREEDYWRHWWLSPGNILIYATYVCAAADRGPEEDVAAAAVDTLRPRTGGD